MIALVFGILLLIVGAIVGGIMIADDFKPQGWAVMLAGVVLCIGFIVMSITVSIPTGYTGIVTTFGRVENYTLDSGFHAKAPWNSIIKMDNRVQKATVDLSCFSSDIQEVTCKYTLNYQINKETAQDIYRNVGSEYYDVVITPNVAEAIKTIMAHYTAEQLIGNRDKLTAEIEENLAEQLKSYNINVVSTAIEDLDFTDAFTNAVEAKQVAQQNKLKATTEQEQKTMEAQQAAERAQIDAAAAAEVAKIQAQADLEVQKINADAAEYTGLKESAKNKAINESLTGELLKYYLIMQWDGKYPTTFMGDDVNALLNIGN